MSGLRGLALAACLASSSALLPAAEEPPQPQPAPKASKLKSPEDGWLDLSAFLDEKYGFVPVLVPITEPAVGYGGALGLMFIGKPRAEGRAGLPSTCGPMSACAARPSCATRASTRPRWTPSCATSLEALQPRRVRRDRRGVDRPRGVRD